MTNKVSMINDRIVINSNGAMSVSLNKEDWELIVVLGYYLYEGAIE